MHVYPKPVPQRLFADTCRDELAAGALELDDFEGVLEMPKEVSREAEEVTRELEDETTLEELEPLQRPNSD